MALNTKRRVMANDEMKTLLMSAPEVIERLENLQNVDRNDFYTDGRLDLAKAERRNKLHQIRGCTFDKSGEVVAIRLYNDHSGHVYLVRAENGLVKIGRAENVKKRLSQLNAHSPISLELIFSQFVNDAAGLEKKLHKMLGSKRIRGEWFELTDNDVRSIVSELKEIEEGVDVQ